MESPGEASAARHGGEGPYRIAPMETRHGVEVGRLHAGLIEHSYMSGLGADFLGALYESLLEMQFGIGVVLLDAEDRVAGFSYGRASRAPMTRVLLRSWRHLLLPLIRVCLTRPRALYRTLVAMLQSDDLIDESGIGEWLSFALVPEARGGSRGDRLVRTLFEQIGSQGCPKIRWAAHGDNARILRFFEKMNARQIRETRISGEPILWFELDLAAR